MKVEWWLESRPKRRRNTRKHENAERTFVFFFFFFHFFSYFEEMSSTFKCHNVNLCDLIHKMEKKKYQIKCWVPSSSCSSVTLVKWIVFFSFFSHFSNGKGFSVSSELFERRNTKYWLPKKMFSLMTIK